MSALCIQEAEFLTRNILNRVIQAAIVMLGVALLIFIMLRIVPGNAIVTMMGEHAKLETIERMTRELGLDQPIYVQLWRYISDAVRGDFGTSYSLNRSVTELIGVAFPNTVRLALAAALIAWVTGIACGIIAAVKKWDTRPALHGHVSAWCICTSFHGGNGTAILPGV